MVHVGKYASHMASMGDTISFQFTVRSGVSCLVGFLQCLTSCKTRMDDTQTQAGWGTTLLGSAATTFGYPPPTNRSNSDIFSRVSHVYRLSVGKGSSKTYCIQ